MDYKRHDSGFKARVVLEAIRGEKTLQELSQEYGVHPNQISRWKKEAEENMVKVFERDKAESALLKEKEQQLEETLKKLGEATVEVSWLREYNKSCVKKLMVEYNKREERGHSLSPKSERKLLHGGTL